MVDSIFVRRKKFIIAIMLIVASAFMLSVTFFLRADVTCWSDEGKYDAQWLGDYDKTDVYEIKSNSQLAAFLVASKSGKTFQNKTIKMAADLDMSAHNWTAAFSAETPFLGTFNGRGYFITGLVFNNADSSSAFIQYNSGTIVNSLFSVNSQASHSAGIAVYNNGKIYNSGVIGTVGSDSSTLSGGITVENNGVIENCYSLAQLKGAGVGGISPKSSGKIDTCAWSGADVASADQANLTNNEKIDDKQAICNKLNKITKDRGWMNWIVDTTSGFGGNPVLTSKDIVATTVPVKGVSLNVRQRTLWVGGEFEIKYTIVPANATNPKVKLFSTNEAVAVVDANGKVKAKGRGYAVIRAQTEDGNKIADCYVTVNPATLPTGIKLENTHFRIPIGKPVQLKYTIVPTGASYWGATFSSGNNSILECSDGGLIVGLQPGVTIVTATTNDGGKSISALVTVVEDSYSEPWDGTIAENFAGGEGTAENPYVIDNAQTLALLAYNVNNGNSYEGVYFRQTANIMVNDISEENWFNDLTLVKTWSPIGNSADTQFKGHYDGGSFAVAGIYIRTDQTAGLFGYAANGSISNLDVKYSYIYGGNYSGGIVGFSSSVIKSCDVGSNSIISGNNYVGGICGYSNASISFCKNLASVTGKAFVGGICGSADAVITNSSNYGSIQGNEKIGGICGSVSLPVENLLNHGSVMGNKIVGGICGYSEMAVVNSYSSSTPEASESYGSICGFAQKPIASYTLEQEKACGNRDNDSLYDLILLDDGSIVLSVDNSSLLDRLNSYKGCILSNSYSMWKYSDNYGIELSYSTIEFSTIINEDIGVELSGEAFNSETGFTFDTINEKDMSDMLNDVNHSDVFKKSPLSVEDVLFSVIVYQSIEVPLSSFRMCIPLDFSKTSLAITEPDYQSFARVALVNCIDGEVYVYIPEVVNKTYDGTFAGMMKCISHTMSDGAVTNSRELNSRTTFAFANNKITISTESQGTWMIVDLGTNEYVTPIETVSTPPAVSEPNEKDKSIDFKSILPIIFIILTVVSSACIVIVYRRKNGTDE